MVLKGSKKGSSSSWFQVSVCKRKKGPFQLHVFPGSKFCFQVLFPGSRIPGWFLEGSGEETFLPISRTSATSFQWSAVIGWVSPWFAHYKMLEWIKLVLEKKFLNHSSPPRYCHSERGFCPTVHWVNLNQALDQTLNWIDCEDLPLDWNSILNIIDKTLSIIRQRHEL